MATVKALSIARRRFWSWSIVFISMARVPLHAHTAEDEPFDVDGAALVYLEQLEDPCTSKCQNRVAQMCSESRVAQPGGELILRDRLRPWTSMLWRVRRSSAESTTPMSLR
eukprot:15088128-Alexandrium_andersonii.AAC.1